MGRFTKAGERVKERVFQRVGLEVKNLLYSNIYILYPHGKMWHEFKFNIFVLLWQTTLGSIHEFVG